jgi:hypothetical protein
VTVAHEKDRFAPAKRVGSGNRVLRKPIEAERFGTGTGAATFSESGHVYRGDVSYARKARNEVLPVL